MRTVYVKLSTRQDVQDFVGNLSGLEGNFDLIDGNYILDARSLMGIFSLDLSKPLRLDIEFDTPETQEAVSRFVVEPPPAKNKKKIEEK